ncbi:hypothetical protein ACOYYX_06975 [Singulisphaera sp. PoT]
MDAGPLDVRAVPLRRGVIQGEDQPGGPRSSGLTAAMSRRAAMRSASLPAAAAAV